MKSFKSIILSVLVLFMALSCQNSQTFDDEYYALFAELIKAFNGNTVTSSGPVRVEFNYPVADAVVGEELPSNIFKLSPSVKGTAKWSSPSSLAFYPEQGALKEGKFYTATVDLGAAAGVSDPQLQKFMFKFKVAEKQFELSKLNVEISAQNPEVATVRGTVTFSEQIALEDVKKAISFSYPENGGALSVSETGENTTFGFAVEGLPLGDKARKAEVTVNGKLIKFSQTKVAEVMLPVKYDFSILSVTENHLGSDPQVTVTFSQPLDMNFDYTGLITLSGASNARFSISPSKANTVVIYYDKADGGDVLNLFISSNLKSAKGKELGQDYRTQISVSGNKPSVRIPYEGTILPDTENISLPFTAVNLAAVDIRIIKIYENNVLKFLQDNDLRGTYMLRRVGKLVYRNTIRLDDDPSLDLSIPQNFSVDLGPMFKKELGAIYRVILSFKKEYSLYGRTPSEVAATLAKTTASNKITPEDIKDWGQAYGYYYEENENYDWSEYNWEERDDPMKPSYYMTQVATESTSLTVSNLGVIAKASDGNNLWVTVNDILTSDPVSGAQITAYDYQLQKVGSSSTNGDGFAQIKVSAPAFAVVVKNNNCTSYLKVSSGDEKSLSRFDTGGEVLTDGLKGFVYGDRGVWRPGDTLHVGLFVFDRAGNLPESHPVNVEIFTPQGQFYTKLTSSKGKNGLYVFNIPTAENDPTGTWHSYFKVGGATFHKALPIETIKANRLKINVKFNNEILQNSTEEKAEISSSWLAGSLASGLKTSMNMTLYKSSFKFDKYKDYTFTNPADSFEASEYEIYSGVLDEKGKTDVTFRMPAAADAPGMLQAAVVCKVQEPGGDESIMTTTKYFSPFSAYVGLKVPENNEDGNLETDKDLKFDVVLVDKNQAPVGGHNLEYHIWKLDWRWWWESGYESLASYVNGSYSEEVAKGKLSSSGNMSFNFKVDYPGWGRYLVYVKDTKGGHAAGKVIYVDWPSWRGRSAKGDPSALAMLSFSTDKNSYKVGESATVYIPAAKGRALVSLENGSRVISRKWVSANEFGDTPYKFDITADMAPNFYVHVTLLQPHAQRGSDLPIRLYGVVPVTVENPASHLEPVIKMKDEIRPQEQFTVKVSEKNNKPMSYTLAIVDEGLLDITSFKTPDPWNAMYLREALGVKTWDLYDDVIGAYSGSFNPLLSIGGDENLKVGNKQDNRFNPVVAYLGPFTLDKGENTHKITLPMYVGSVRVMVVAGANGAYGNAEKSVPVKAPLMILSSFPKIVGTSEKISLPVNIFSMEDKPMNASVKVTVEGPAKVSENSKSVNCAPNSSQVADFEIVTGSDEGTLKVTINAEGAGFKASETSYIEIKNPNPQITTVSRKAVGKGKSVDLSFAPFEASGSDRATLEIAAFPSLDFNKCYNFFMDYPYSCSEQISSRGIGLVAMKKYLTQEQASKIDSIIPGLLGQIYSRQLPDGGFVYWPGASMADEWVTSMAGHFLTVAAANGYQISSTVYQKWLGYQRKASNNYKRSEQQIFDMVQAYRLFTLALSSNPDHGAMNRLKERSDLSVSSQWLLAAAYSLQGKQAVAKEIIKNISAPAARYDNDYITYGSSLRDKALCIESLVLAGEGGQSIELAQECADEFEQSGYVSQATAFAAEALCKLASVSATSVKAIVNDGRDQSVKAAKPVWSTSVNAAAGKISVKNESDGTLYVSLLTVKTPSDGEAVQATSSNITTDIAYYDLKGAPLDVSTLAQGTEFKAVVTVKNFSAGNKSNLALSFNSPAGWTIFNDRLYSGASESKGYSYMDIRDDRVIWYFDLPTAAEKSFTVRLTANYAGSYTLPATVCEAMYEPKTFAGTPSGKCSVVK